MQVVPRLSVEPMRYEDIGPVQAIERQVFASPWPKNAYASELSQNRQASYIVLRQDGELVGYAGLWRVALEAHITTIGVRAGDHSKGYGTVLFAALVQRDEMKAAFLAALARDGIDALLTPTTQTAAVRVEAVDQTTTPAAIIVPRTTGVARSAGESPCQSVRHPRARVASAAPSTRANSTKGMALANESIVC